MNEYEIRRQLVDLDIKIRNLSTLLWLVFAMIVGVLFVAIVGTCRCSAETSKVCCVDKPRKSMPFASRPRKESANETDARRRDAAPERAEIEN